MKYEDKATKKVSHSFGAIAACLFIGAIIAICSANTSVDWLKWPAGIAGLGGAIYFGVRVQKWRGDK